jgi:hypothetical protein
MTNHPTVPSTAKFALGAACMLLPVASFACRCVEPEPPAPAYRNAAAVIVGTVTNIRQNAEKTAIATVRVSQRWKKQLPDEIEVATVPTTCAFEFKPDMQYVLYVRELPNGGGYVTAKCRGNLPLSEAEKPLAWLKKNGAEKK